MSVQWDTFSVPFIDGISPATRDRLLPATKLLALENGYVFNQRQISKRNGHDAYRVKTSAVNVPTSAFPPLPTPYRPAFSLQDPQVSPNWLFGWGKYQDGISKPVGTDPFEVSPQAEAGLLHGSFTRDNETVVWDGFRTFSYAANTAFGETYSPPNRGPAILPQMKVEIAGKTSSAQRTPDAADNGTIRVVAWVNPTFTSYSYSVFDSVTGACLVDAATIALQSCYGVRVIICGTFANIVALDITGTSLDLRTFNQSTLNTVVARSFAATSGSGVHNLFDIKKVDETQFIIGWVSANTVASLLLLSANGTNKNTWSVNTGASNIFSVAVAASTYGSPTAALLVYDTATLIPNIRLYDLFSGAQVGSTTALTSTGSGGRLTLTPCFGQYGVYHLFVDTTSGGFPLLKVYRVDCIAATSTLIASRFNVQLASQAFYVGNRSFVWVVTSSTLQATYFLVDATGKPVGKMSYGTAQVPLATSSGAPAAEGLWLPSVNFTQLAANNGLQDKDRYVWCGALGFRQRIENSALTHGNPTGVFAEQSIKFYTLDFLAPLRAAQAGRSTFVAGAQLWDYDGTEFNEAGFNGAPVVIGPPVATATAGLPNGTYRYRVDLCYKTAQNEEVRSWSLITPSVVSALKKITLDIQTFPATRREDAYFLVYRTQTIGTNFFLCSSRDPTVTGDNGFILNNTSVGDITWTDNLDDTTLAAREYHPANAGGNYLDPLPSPPCQLVAGGAGRLWLAGGELNPGEIAPSRQFAVGESPAFHPVLNIQVDRNIEPITAITFQGDLGVVFRRSSAYFLETDGPDNTLNPQTWQQPRLALTDCGAIGQEGIAVTTQGVWFQSLTGIRLLSPGGGIVPGAGQEVDPIAEDMNIAATVVVPDLEHVRFYSRDANRPTLVYNYTSSAWSTWTNTHGVGASYWVVGDKTFVARADGNLWVENPAVFTDGGSPFEFRLRVSWQKGGDLSNYLRFRRFAVFGLYVGPHTLRMRLFYNEEPFWREEFRQAWPPASAAVAAQGGAFAAGSFSTAFDTAFTTGQAATSQDTYGSLTWGSGSWGDASNVNGGDDLWFRNGVYRDRRRPKIQKCSVFSVELSDMSAPNNSFIPIALGFEVGKKNGLDRIPANANG